MSRSLSFSYCLAELSGRKAVGLCYEPKTPYHLQPSLLLRSRSSVGSAILTHPGESHSQRCRPRPPSVVDPCSCLSRASYRPGGHFLEAYGLTVGQTIGADRWSGSVGLARWQQPLRVQRLACSMNVRASSKSTCAVDERSGRVVLCCGSGCSVFRSAQGFFDE
jgi:hypothetical protein